MTIEAILPYVAVQPVVADLTVQECGEKPRLIIGFATAFNPSCGSKTLPICLSVNQLVEMIISSFGSRKSVTLYAGLTVQQDLAGMKIRLTGKACDIVLVRQWSRINLAS